MKKSGKTLQKTSTLRSLFIFKTHLLCVDYFFLINHTRKLFWHSNLNELEGKNLQNNNQNILQT